MAGHGARVPDETLIRLNDLGLSLKRMGELTGYHWTTIHVRLNELGLKSVDTRRAFMDDIYQQLTPNQREWLMDQLGLGQPIASLVRMLIVEKYNNRKRA